MYGALRSPEDSRDYIFERLAKSPAGYYATQMPTEYDLRKFGRPSRDQGYQSTCAAHTGALIKEIQETRDCGFSDRMSPDFIYYHRENRPGAGMYGRNVFQILCRYGSAPDHLYQPDVPPTDEVYQAAKKFRISNYARVTTIDGLKQALLELGPCYLQLPMYDTRPEFWRPSGNKPTTSGHAVTVVGYTAAGFIIQNSWGPTWHDDGCIIFPYDDWGAVWECWTCADEKTDLGPSVKPAKKKKKMFKCF